MISESDLDDFTERSGWLYRRSVPSGGLEWVHLPLVYTTRCGVELEAYAAALLGFPRLCGAPEIRPVLRHGVVVGIPEGDSMRLARRGLDRLDDRPWIEAWIDRAAASRASLAAVCLALEPPLLAGFVPPLTALGRSREVLSDAIAVGLLAPLAEARWLFPERGETRPGLPAPSFSWVRWFDERRRDLDSATRDGTLSPTEVADFAWQAGFLARTVRDRQKLSDPKALAEDLGLQTAPTLASDLAVAPPLPAAPARPATSEPLGLLRYLLQALGDLEEIRHYWQARLARNWRLVAERLGLHEAVGLEELTTAREPPQSESLLAPRGPNTLAPGIARGQVSPVLEPGRFPKVDGLLRLRSLGLDTQPLAVVGPEVCAGVDDSGPSTGFEQALEGALRLLGPTPDGVSVRSASSLEDGHESSMAGRFESFNGLTDRGTIHRAAHHVIDQHRQEVGERPLALILQPTFPCWMAGVAFIQNDPDGATRVVVEASWGSGYNVVDGGVEPYRSTLLRSEGQGSWRHSWDAVDPGAATGPKAEIYRMAAGCFVTPEGLAEGTPLEPQPGPFVAGPRLLLPPATREWVVYGDRPRTPPPWYEEQVCGVFEALACRPGGLCDVDLEWGVDWQGRLVFFQVRPITARIQTTERPQNSEAATEGWRGLPASPGRFRGTVVDPSNRGGGDVEPGEAVVMLDQVSEIELYDLRRCGAVLATTGGILSHVAILCRELGIPCVTGLGTRLAVGQRVVVDGTTGWVGLDGAVSGARADGAEGLA